jgi:hypothetical protein
LLKFAVGILWQVKGRLAAVGGEAPPKWGKKRRYDRHDGLCRFSAMPKRTPGFEAKSELKIAVRNFVSVGTKTLYWLLVNLNFGFRFSWVFGVFTVIIWEPLPQTPGIFLGIGISQAESLPNAKIFQKAANSNSLSRASARSMRPAIP